MTKKDYELIAEVLLNNVSGVASEPYAITLVNDMANALQDDNPKFDRNKFLIACGVETTEPTAFKGVLYDR